jgi:hypothetical protein
VGKTGGPVLDLRECFCASLETSVTRCIGGKLKVSWGMNDRAAGFGWLGVDAEGLGCWCIDRKRCWGLWICGFVRRKYA